MKKIYKRYELRGKILSYFLDQIEVPTMMLFYPRSEIYKSLGVYDHKDRKRIRHALDRLRLDKFIRIHGAGDDTKIAITPFGRKLLNKSNFKKLSLNKSKKWDGKWRVVMFDIPEAKKKARNAVSLKLKQLGFNPIQKSVFVYPFDCREEIDFVKDYFNLNDNINYMLVEKIDDEKSFRKKFNL